ncbi:MULTISPECIES: purine-cytosine permease family protein [Actinomadura]|uniref:Purine-cytosine permease family protein n=1 Tax=Actinomadura yumaensis TaxID=111807 RepID=A0ABW2CVS8_9ACTN|nr:cytosine permease [Actinomadura sp. J1-007]MWK40196.1 permease [Actinomadura sp. J1-007]
MSEQGAAPRNPSASTIEKNGVNPVPDAERGGTPRGLFGVWFSWNVSIMGVGYGIFVFGLGLSAWQAIVAGILGYVLSSLLVGVLAVGGPRTGLPTLTQTRFAFGLHGNRVPAFFAYLSNVGWKVTIITLASTTGAALFARLWPSAFAKSDGTGTTPAIVLWFVVVLAATVVAAVFGHRFIVRIENWIAWVTGAFTLVFIGLIIPHVHWSRLGDTGNGSFWTFVGGVIMAMTMVGLGFLNYGGDFARYLPRGTRARGVIGWTAGGITLPVAVLLVLGVLLAGTNPSLGAKAADAPIAALTELLPLWFFIPFSVVIVISLVAAAITGLYSSGLALLAIGVPTSRAGTTVINMVLISAGAFYLLFVSDSFLATFQAFLALIAVPMGTMGGIQLLDFVRQRRLGWDVSMALPAGYGGRSGRWTALVSLVAASVVGLGLVTSSDPNIGEVVGFLLPSGAQDGIVAKTNLGVVIAMIIGAALYALLTYGLRFQVPGDRSKPAEPEQREAVVR